MIDKIETSTRTVIVEPVEDYIDTYDDPTTHDSDIQLVTIDNIDRTLGNYQFPTNDNCKSIKEWFYYFVLDHYNLEEAAEKTLSPEDYEYYINSHDDNGYELDDSDERTRVLFPFLEKWINDNLITLPVAAYEHGGISLSTKRTGNFTCVWDSYAIGVVFAKKNDYLTEIHLDNFIREYSSYLEGDIYRVNVYDKNNLNDTIESFTIYGYDNIEESIKTYR